MSKNNSRKNFEYYPFRLTGCSFADFTAAFQEMDGCEIGAAFVFDIDSPEMAESIDIDKATIEKASIDPRMNINISDPRMNINISGSYYGKPVSFLFTCGALIATDYGADQNSVKAMIADVCKHLT